MMTEKDILIGFLEDINRLNLSADPDLHYTLFWLKGDKHLIHEDIQMRTGKSIRIQDQIYVYSNNYIFEDDKLLELYLSKMKISILPDTISNFSHLQKLFLGNNELTYVPESISSLTQLKSLNLSKNRLTTIPDSIGKLDSLEELDISGNRLIDLPYSIANLTKLEILRIQDNSLPDHLINNDISDVQKFIKNI